MLMEQYLKASGKMTQLTGIYKEDPMLQLPRGKNACINILLSREIDIESSTYCGTALNVAAQKGKYDTVKMLIEKGSNIHSEDGSDLRDYF